jgi:hypothetical protein
MRPRGGLVYLFTALYNTSSGCNLVNVMSRLILPSHSFFAAIVLTLMCSTALAVPQGPAIGNITLALGTVTGVDQDGDSFEIARGANVYAGYTLETGRRSFVRVLMKDGTRMTLSQNGSASLDRFSFNESTNRGGFDMTVARGGFKYSSGKLGKFSSRRKHSTISTPGAVIGVRGTEFDIVLNGNQVHVTVRQGAIDLRVTTPSGRVVTQSFGEGEAALYAEVTALGEVIAQAQEPTETQELTATVTILIGEAAENEGIDAGDVDNIEEDATEEDATEEDATEEDATEEDATEEDATEEDATEEDATEEGTTEDGTTDEGASDEGPADEAPADTTPPDAPTTETPPTPIEPPPDSPLSPVR